MTREEAIECIRGFMGQLTEGCREAIIIAIPELRESEDERIRKAALEGIEYLECKLGWDAIGDTDILDVKEYLEKQKDASKAIEAVDRIDKYIDEHLANAHDMKDSNPDKKYYRGWDDALGKMAGILQDVYSGKNQKEQKSIEMEVHEVGKGTTICGQDYKCKKDYKEGNCWYIKDVIYHCGRDGYLTDQNGISWSCTPKWFNEYIYSNAEWTEEEKTRFVSGQFLRCKLSFDGFKKGEHYWLEYIGDDMYVGRSDNILNQKFLITPGQLYTLFSQQLDEVQGPPQEEKQVSLNYEPPFNENPSDKEIIEALIKHLKEQDGFLTAIDCVSTKAILSWLEKQKEQDKCPEYCVRSHCIGCSIYEKQKEQKPWKVGANAYFTPEQKPANEQFPPLEGLDAIKAKYYDEGFKNGFDEGVASVKPAEWSDEDEANIDYLIDFCNSYYNGSTRTLTESVARTMSNWLYRVKSGEISLPKSRLDENDEKAIHLACEFIRHHSTKIDSIGGIDCSELVKRLKSLPERFNLQPKQEWGEEDKRALNDAIIAISMYANGQIPYILPSILLEDVERLKSLRPCLSDEEIQKIRSEEYTKGFNDAAFGGKVWKPSKEQLEALGIAMDRNDSIGYNLRQLYEQLKSYRK